MVLTHYTSPCKGCQDRKVTEDFNCHTSCPAYLDFRAKVDEANAQKPIASDISSYTEVTRSAGSMKTGKPDPGESTADTVQTNKKSPRRSTCSARA